MHFLEDANPPVTPREGLPWGSGHSGGGSPCQADSSRADFMPKPRQMPILHLWCHCTLGIPLLTHGYHLELFN